MDILRIILTILAGLVALYIASRLVGFGFAKSWYEVKKKLTLNQMEDENGKTKNDKKNQ